MHNRGADRRAPVQLQSITQLGLSEDRRRGGDRRERGFISRLQLFFTVQCLSGCIGFGVTYVAVFTVGCVFAG